MVEAIDEACLAPVEREIWYAFDRRTAQGVALTRGVGNKYWFNLKGRSLGKTYRRGGLGNGDVYDEVDAESVINRTPNTKLLQSEFVEQLGPSEMPSANGHTTGAKRNTDFLRCVPHNPTIGSVLPPGVIHKLYERFYEAEEQQWSITSDVRLKVDWANLPVDRLTAQDRHAVKEETDKYVVGFKGRIKKRVHRTGYGNEGKAGGNSLLDGFEKIRNSKVRNRILGHWYSEKRNRNNVKPTLRRNPDYVSDNPDSVSGSSNDQWDDFWENSIKALAPSQIPSSNGHEMPKEESGLVYDEPHDVSIESVLPLSVLDGLYGRRLFLATAHSSTGVDHVGYSSEFTVLAGKMFREWREMAVRREKLAKSIQEATGLRPEDLEEYRHIFAARLRGVRESSQTPIKIIIID